MFFRNNYIISGGCLGAAVTRVVGDCRGGTPTISRGPRLGQSPLTPATMLSTICGLIWQPPVLLSESLCTCQCVFVSPLEFNMIFSYFVQDENTKIIIVITTFLMIYTSQHEHKERRLWLLLYRHRHTIIYFFYEFLVTVPNFSYSGKRMTLFICLKYTSLMNLDSRRHMLRLMIDVVIVVTLRDGES